MADRRTERKVPVNRRGLLPDGTPYARETVPHSPGMFAAKVALRLTVLPRPDARPTRVLDAFAGTHSIWDAASEIRPDLEVLHIDQKPTRSTDLRGNNLRYLESMDLGRFDLIDLDSWGQPDRQVQLLAERAYRGVVTWTAITSTLATGQHAAALLAAEGIDPAWVKECRTVFDMTALRRRWLNFLATLGWTEAVVLEAGKANHLYGAVSGSPLAWDDAAYRGHYDAVRHTGRYASLGVGQPATLAK